MQLIFTDALIAENYAQEHNVPTDTGAKIAAHLYSEIFAKYKITKQDYFKSYDYYTRHPELFERAMGPIIDSLNAMEARMPGKAKAPPVVIAPALEKNQPVPKIMRLNQPVIKK